MEIQDIKARLFDIIVKDIYIIITKSQNFEEYVGKTLKSIAQALDVDRICIYEFLETKEYIKTFEYNAPNIDVHPTGDNIIYDTLHNELVEAFYKTGFIEYRQVKKEEIKFPKIINFMERNDLQSMLIIPIVVDHKYWGFMLFNDFSRDRVVKEVELDIFKYVAFNIGAAIYVQRHHDNIKKLNEQLEQALTIAQQLIARNTRLMIRENEILKKNVT